MNLLFFQSVGIKIENEKNLASKIMYSKLRANRYFDNFHKKKKKK